MLAYSSVEHMGILAVGAALGTAGLYATLYHVWNNGLTKGALFLSAGNIRRAARARTADTVSGMGWCAPISARVLVVGLFAITAMPPFGPFFSQLGIIRAGLETNHGSAIIVFTACLMLAFIGLTRLTFAIVDGRPRAAARMAKPTTAEAAGVVIPPIVFLALSLWLGLAAPALLQDSWTAAAAYLERVR